MAVRLTFERPSPEGDQWDQGIDTIECDGAELRIEGWFDMMALWGDSVTLTADQRRTLAAALLEGL